MVWRDKFQFRFNGVKWLVSCFFSTFYSIFEKLRAFSVGEEFPESERPIPK